MNSAKLFLRPNVAAEVLIDYWCAWRHSLSLTTAALNLTGRHLKIMESYVKAPQIHAVTSSFRGPEGVLSRILPCG
jgi:hypothetical protein